MDTLEILIQSKKANPDLAHDVVSAAAAWLNKELRSAGVSYHLADSEHDFCGYAMFQFHRTWKGTDITLFIKIAEVRETPYVFADIRVREQEENVLFPFFGEIGSDEGKEIILNYLADFLLSVEANGHDQ
ncbi:MAG: hypothetical protein AAFX93_11895 [Verrucomicrobiota bacterium]